MKIAILSESPADEAAIRILVDAIRGEHTEWLGSLRVPSRGYDGVRKSLPRVIAHLHYRTDADALVTVVDSDRTSIHLPEHEQPGNEDPACRLCLLRGIAKDARGELAALHGRRPLTVAVGLACPSIEAWYQCGLDAHATEAAWQRDLDDGADAPIIIRNRLKRAVYGTDRPSLALETQHAVAHAQRLARQTELLEKSFPMGFGSLSRTVGDW
ncbi:MAG: hypothetical protein JXQ73_00220 [Phycisphaerae bacterium]|nr:hypothetical protein [Phycisphaerae bacterium]